MTSTRDDAAPPPERRVFCNRTLNLRAIQAIGYDMDYTLIHYNVAAWEARSFDHIKRKLAELGWPVEGLTFDFEGYQLGLVIDRQLGNIVKANRFGYVKRSAHGTRDLDLDAQRRAYAETIVDLADPRFIFMNTLFAIAAASMYAQLVDRLDAGEIPGAIGYSELYDVLQDSLDAAHMEGQLKGEIMADPERYVLLDPEMPLTLLDQHRCGKRLMLITNSEWHYTQFLMDYAFRPFLPEGMAWRDLFKVVIVAAAKPLFFTRSQPAFEVVDEHGHLLPVVGTPSPGRILHGGHAGLVEAMLGLEGGQILYIGDHAYGDVHVTKKILRWRTALVIRELEEEVREQRAFAPTQEELSCRMAAKEGLEHRYAALRLALQRRRHQRKMTRGRAAGQAADRMAGRAGGRATGRAGGRADSRAKAAAEEASKSGLSIQALEKEIEGVRKALSDADAGITPLALASAQIHNPRWGLLMRSGGDRSYLARIIERHADIYTSRVSNLMYETPYAFFRARRGRLPHD